MRPTSSFPIVLTQPRAYSRMFSSEGPLPSVARTGCPHTAGSTCPRRRSSPKCARKWLLLGVRPHPQIPSVDGREAVEVVACHPVRKEKVDPRGAHAGRDVLAEQLEGTGGPDEAVPAPAV